MIKAGLIIFGLISTLVFTGCLSVDSSSSDGSSTITTSSSSASAKIIDPANWYPATTNAGFTLRVFAATAVFNNHLWVIGGNLTLSFYPSMNDSTNDVWYTSDGSNWYCANSSAAFPSSLNCVHAFNFNDKLWVIGRTNGVSSYGGYQTWYTDNGTNWNQASGYIYMELSYDAKPVVYNGSIWFYGSTGKVYQSTDGTNFLLKHTITNAPIRMESIVLSFNNNLWFLTGNRNGQGTPDAWCSADGTNWTFTTTNAGYGKRLLSSGLVYNNSLWIIAGDYNPGSVPDTFTNDIWRSSDGIDWYCVTNTTAFKRRAGHNTELFNNRMWVIGGIAVDSNNYHLVNDVWYAE